MLEKEPQKPPEHTSEHVKSQKKIPGGVPPAPQSIVGAPLYVFVPGPHNPVGGPACTYVAVISSAVSLSPATGTARRATTLTVYSTTVPQEKRAAVTEQQCRVVFNQASQGDKTFISGEMMLTWYDCGRIEC